MTETREVEAAAGSLAGIMGDSARVVAFTGAGASAASGVPTYRGAGGTWTRYDPNRYASIDGFVADPTYYWSFFRDERYPSLQRARANPVHRCLAEMERAGKLSAVVTQNIDGLHQEAGSERVLELHGSTRRFRCEQCTSFHGLDAVWAEVEQEIPPRCPMCREQGLRPDVVFFGEGLSPDVLVAAFDEMDKADLAVVVGSSLVVQPAASLPLRTLSNGGALVIVNLDPTPLDGTASLVVREPADQVLPRALELL